MESSDIIVSFITKDSDYAIPSLPLNVKSSATPEDLESIIKALLAESSSDDLQDVEFDFLFGDKLIRSSLGECLTSTNLTFEHQVEVEYFVKARPPKPHSSFQLDDWVASVRATSRWILSGCYDNSAHIFDLDSGEHVTMIPAHHGPVKAVKWIETKGSDRDLKFITCSYDQSAMLWQWDSTQNSISHLFTYLGHSKSVDCVDVSGDLVATGSYDTMLKIWSLNPEDSETEATDASKDSKRSKLRSPVMTIGGHRDGVTGCVWLPEETSPTVASGSLDQSLKLWDVELGEQKQTLTCGKSFFAIDYSPVNRLLISGNSDRHVRLWDPRASEGVQVKAAYTSHTGWVSSVSWSPNDSNLFVSGGHDNSVKEWDLRSTVAPLYELTGHEDKVLSVHWSPKNHLVSGGADQHIKVFKAH